MRVCHRFCILWQNLKTSQTQSFRNTIKVDMSTDLRVVKAKIV